MDASVLRRIITHWFADLDFARLEVDVRTVLRVRDRRKRERQAADEEVMRAFERNDDESDER